MVSVPLKGGTNKYLGSIVNANNSIEEKAKEIFRLGKSECCQQKILRSKLISKTGEIKMLRSNNESCGKICYVLESNYQMKVNIIPKRDIKKDMNE